MKDIVITAKRIKKEFATFIICLLICILANVGAILYYNSEWIELLTSLHYVLIATIFVYLSAVVIRLLYYIVKSRLTKNN